MKPLLTLSGLSKSYFGVPVVSDMKLDFAIGRAVGLIGENGAGKSTLMNMIGGVVPPTTGTMQWQGAPYAPASPADATLAGIAFIHQELNLFTNLSVAENIFIDDFPRRLGLIDRAHMRRRSAELLDQLNLSVSPDAAVGDLAPGERQLVEIAKALHREARMMIFDEPTTSLTARETERLFETIKTLRDGGTAIVYISHILADVQNICDDIVVLRDGKLVDQGPVADFDISRMIASMIGRRLSAVYPERSSEPTDRKVLEVANLSQDGVVEGITFDVHEGEILGMFGLMGSGRSELARMIFGLDSARSGSVRFRQSEVGVSVRERIAAGMAFVTENRREEGLMMDAAISENLALVRIRDFGRTPVALIDKGKLEARTAEIRDEVTVKAGNIYTQPVRSLSGGNQQKVVIGKWLMGRPDLFILDEPTRGVDVGAKHEIYTLVDNLAASGSGVLLISSELEELLGTCDRILVMSHGEITGTFPKSAFDHSRIMACAFGENAA